MNFGLKNLDGMIALKLFISVYWIIMDERNFEVGVDGLTGIIKWGIGYFSEDFLLEGLDFRDVRVRRPSQLFSIGPHGLQECIVHKKSDYIYNWDTWILFKNYYKNNLNIYLTQLRHYQENADLYT